MGCQREIRPLDELLDGVLGTRVNGCVRRLTLMWDNESRDAAYLKTRQGSRPLQGKKWSRLVRHSQRGIKYLSRLQSAAAYNAPHPRESANKTIPAPTIWLPNCCYTWKHNPCGPAISIVLSWRVLFEEKHLRWEDKAGLRSARSGRGRE